MSPARPPRSGAPGSSAPASSSRSRATAETWEADEARHRRAPTFEAFARAVDGKAPFPIPPEQIIHGASVTEAMIRSAASGKVEKVS